MSESILTQALQQIDSLGGVLKVAQDLGYYDLKNGVQKSPFRTDNKGKSFSISDQGRRFKDHALEEHKGGSWNFVRLARPDWPKGEVARYLIRLAGMEDMASTEKVDAKKWRADQLARKKQAMADEQRKFDAKMSEIPAVGPLEEMSFEVSERWQAGSDMAQMDKGAGSRLAASRGWYDRWVKDMAAAELLAYPFLPWCDPGAPRAARGWAFPVHMPVFDGGKLVSLSQVGYHQRFTMDHGKTKQWCFVPYVPASEPKENSAELTRKLYQQDRRIPALPFVCGCFDAPQVVIVVEGQWDALTLWRAVGGDEFPALILGARGAQGIDPLIGAWGRWLQRLGVPVVLIADNDAAGGTWFRTKGEIGKRRTPCFADRLETGLGLEVKRQILKPGTWGNDLNDLYRAKQFGRQSVCDALEKLGVTV